MHNIIIAVSANPVLVIRLIFRACPVLILAYLLRPPPMLTNHWRAVTLQRKSYKDQRAEVMRKDQQFTVTLHHNPSKDHRSVIIYCSMNLHPSTVEDKCTIRLCHNISKNRCHLRAMEPAIVMKGLLVAITPSPCLCLVSSSIILK